MSNNINFYIAVDAMGGDGSPDKVINGSRLFLDSNNGVKLIIFGDKKKIDSNFLCEIKDVSRLIPSELNASFFKKAYPKIQLYF